jgi:hypothetical protein
MLLTSHSSRFYHPHNILFLLALLKFCSVVLVLIKKYVEFAKGRVEVVKISFGHQLQFFFCVRLLVTYQLKLSRTLFFTFLQLCIIPVVFSLILCRC